MTDFSVVSLLIAFGAGIISFASPCCLPMVPVYVTYIVGVGPAEQRSSRRVALEQAVAFVLGFTVVFVALWASIGLVGYVLRDYVSLLREVGGAILIVMGLHVAGLISIPALVRDVHLPAGRLLQRRDDGTVETRRPNVGRSLLFGVIFAAGWTPCVGPILGGIIGMASLRSSVGQGAVLLIVYALGLGIPFILVALGASTVRNRLAWFVRHDNVVSVVAGVLIIVVGFLMMTNLMVMLPKYLPSFNV